MLAVFFYGIASMLLPVLIINATGPAIDYSHLSKPTATVSSFPPAPAPAVGIMSTSQDSSLDLLLAMVANSKYALHNKRTSSSYSSFWPWRLSTTLSSRRRSSRKTAATTTAGSSTMGRPETEYGQEKEQTPQKSTYSPPASYSVEDYEQYQLRHTTSFNKSKSGFCGTDTSSSEEQQQYLVDDWKAHMQINLPIKP